ncbi:MAG: M23 family metallopeptidase [Anaerolineales bacterium]|nr:M23 family metallopeptidase [Anaerolineales bacterium]
MKRFIYFPLSLLIIACNLPVPADAAPPTALMDTNTPPPSTPTLAPISTDLPTLPPAPTPTVTPIPCDPITTDYCISAWVFPFQRPILPPDMDRVDMSYMYASTQNRKRDPHHGVEFQNAFGTPVHAAGNGVVVFADSDKATKFAPWNNFYGNLVVIQHADEMYTLYAHLSSILVQVGDEVAVGDVIGQVGATGGATGPHLHFEVRAGSDYTEYFSTQNPELWLAPPYGMGALSITFKAGNEKNYERPMVISKYADDSETLQFTYYVSSYAKGFEYHPEDCVLNSLQAGRYKIAFSDAGGLHERFVVVAEGRLTEVVFEVK